MTNLLSVSDLYAGYETFDVLQGAQLEMSSGETVAIIGPNGAGKSTLLKAIFGIIRPRRGAIHFGGEPIQELSPRARLRRGISYVPQGRVNFPEMTVEENLEVAGQLNDHQSVQRKKAELMDRFPILGGRRRQLAGTLSGGEQQMLELAMALMLDPRLMLIDEPSLGLDPRNVDLVFETIRALRDEQVTMILVEQNAARALKGADRAYVIDQGRTRMSGEAASVLNDPEVKRLYLGGRVLEARFP